MDLPLTVPRGEEDAASVPQPRRPVVRAQESGSGATDLPTCRERDQKALVALTLCSSLSDLSSTGSSRFRVNPIGRSEAFSWPARPLWRGVDRSRTAWPSRRRQEYAPP